MPVNPEKGDIVRMVGNPSLGAVKVIHLAVKNRSKGIIFDGEVWVNELRVTGYNEEFAWAAQSRLQVQMADLGELNFAANYSSNGFGGLDKRLHERSREEYRCRKTFTKGSETHRASLYPISKNVYYTRV
jgi:cell surface protein SprA